MNKKSKITVLLAGIAVSATAVATAYADNGPRGMMMRDGEGPHYGRNMPDGMGPGRMGADRMFQRADKDNSGAVTLEEFAAMSPFDFGAADADGNGNLTADEIAAQMERDMLKRRAERMIRRFDTDNDGQVSQAEIDNHRQRMFARLDIDGSGAIEKDELPQPRGDRRGGDERGQGRGDGQGYHHHGQFGR